ncbi:MAG: transcriptional repressor LexA [Bdellovibrionales bacterium]
MLTQKQKDLLVLIHDRLAANGVPPSFEEMKTALGLHSKSGIHRLITGLEDRGFIRRLPHRARALEILRMPETGERASLARHSSNDSVRPPDEFATSLTIPLYGRIAAGTPIEALRDPSAQLEIPPSMLGKSPPRTASTTPQHYALEIAGDSMIEAGILDGDRIVIRACDTAENGAIVVALIHDHEATLKFFERRGNQIALIPANKNYETRLLPADAVKVQGTLIGLVRNY